MRKFLTDRKGAALEMAIMLAVVTFALSTLVLTVALLQHNSKINAEKNMTRGIVLEQVGEDFCYAVANGTGHDWKNGYTQYDIVIEDTSLAVTDRSTGTLLLKVVLTAAGDGSYTVTEWNKK